MPISLYCCLPACLPACPACPPLQAKEEMRAKEALLRNFFANVEVVLRQQKVATTAQRWEEEERALQRELDVDVEEEGGQGALMHPRSLQAAERALSRQLDFDSPHQHQSGDKSPARSAGGGTSSSAAGGARRGDADGSSGRV